MHIAILSGGDGWHVRDLRRAGELLDCEATALDFRKLCANVGTQSNALPGFQAVLVRTMPPGSLEQVIFRMDLLQRLQANGVVVLNPPRAVEICVDKYLTSACLQAAGMLVPETIVCQHADAALEAFETLGGDVIVKPLFGSEGRGMIRLQDQETAWRAFRTLERLQAVLYLQKYIAHPGWDLRAFVIGGEVVAAMKRRSNGCWRTNVAQGGKAESVRLTAAEQELALRAAAAMQAPVAGVDLLPGPGGELYVLEVNAVPGWRALAAATSVDVAQLILRFLCAQVGEPGCVSPRRGRG